MKADSISASRSNVQFRSLEMTKAAKTLCPKLEEKLSGSRAIQAASEGKYFVLDTFESGLKLTGNKINGRPALIPIAKADVSNILYAIG